MAKMQQQSAAPTRKLIAGGLVGAVTTIVVWIIESAGNIKVPGAIAVAISTVLTAIVSYLVPPSARDQIVPS